jgi:hypothetical protein
MALCVPVRRNARTRSTEFCLLAVPEKAWVLGSQPADPANQAGAFEAWASFASNLAVNLYRRCGAIRCS